MIPTVSIAQLFRRVAGDTPFRSERYTAEEVRDLLTADVPESPSRAREARDVAAIPTDWLGSLEGQQRRQIGALADRLPLLVYLHGNGASVDDLRARFGGLTSWRYEVALDTAYACIARCLNRRDKAA